MQLADTLQDAEGNTERMQKQNQRIKNSKRSTDSGYNPGDKVLIKTQIVRNASKQVSSKLAPKRNGPYAIQSKRDPASYVVKMTAVVFRFGNIHILTNKKTLVT